MKRSTRSEIKRTGEKLEEALTTNKRKQSRTRKTENAHGNVSIVEIDNDSEIAEINKIIETRIAEAKQQQMDEILARNLQKEFDKREKEREDNLKRDYLLARMVAERQSAIQYKMQINGQVMKVSGNPSSLANFSLLPTYTYKQTSDGNVEECMICLDKYEPNCKVTHLLCSHKYHTECIRKWLSNNNNCPFCHTNAVTGL